MLNVDEDDVICDLAETYHIFDYKGLPLQQVATFCCGLRDNARIKLKMADSPVSIETIMLASILDQTNFLAWSKTEDATRGYGRPKSVLNSILNRDAVNEYETFNNADEFDMVRRSLLEQTTWI